MRNIATGTRSFERCRKKKHMENNFWKTVYTIFTLIILVIQINIAINQYRLTEVQNHLSESNRESSYASELFNIISLVGQETYKYSSIADSVNDANSGYLLFSTFDILDRNPDTTRKVLSPVLANRISSFTQYIEPYSILESSGSLSKELYSPERKKLFKYLVYSYADLKNILFKSDFSHLYLTDFSISRRYLRGLNISNSLLKNITFYRSDLSCSNYSNSKLINTNFTNCVLLPADFDNAIMDSVSFRNSYMPYAIHFKGAYIKHVDLTDALVPDKEWLVDLKSKLKKCGNIDEYTIEEKPVDSLIRRHTDNTYFYRIIKKK